MELVILLMLIGFVGTFFSGLIGMGGAIINYPMLLYVPGLFGAAEFSAHDVSGMIAWQVLFATSSSLVVFRKEKMIHLPLVTVMGTATLVGSFAGGYGAKFLSGDAVNLTYAILALLAAVMMFVSVGGKRKAGASGESADAGDAAEGAGGAGGSARGTAVASASSASTGSAGTAVSAGSTASAGSAAVVPSAQPFNKTAAAAIALVVGTVSGIVGLGGGFLLIPAMLLLLRIPLRMAIASTIAIGFISSLATNVGKMMAGPVPLIPSAILVSMSLIAAPLGIAVGKRMKSKTLKKVAGTVILAASIKIWADILW